MSTPTGVQIGTYEMDSREDQVITFDVGAWLDPADVIAAGAPELVRISDGLNYAAGLRGSPAIDQHLIAQEVYQLEKGERYWLILPFTHEGETFAPRIQISVPTL